MRRHFYDAYCGVIGGVSTDEIVEKYTQAVKAGFYACAPCLLIEPTAEGGVGEVREKTRELRALMDSMLEEGKRVYLRCHLRGLDKAAAKRVLSALRGFCDLVSVEAQSRELTAFACHDRRVDIITLTPDSPRLFKGDMEYIAKYGKFVEVPFYYIYSGSPSELARRIFILRNLLSEPVRRNLPVLFSSGPNRSLDPRSLLAFAELLLDIDYAAAANAMSRLIEERIAINIEKRTGIRPVEGVRVETW